MSHGITLSRETLPPPPLSSLALSMHHYRLLIPEFAGIQSARYSSILIIHFSVGISKGSHSWLNTRNTIRPVGPEQLRHAHMYTIYLVRT